MKALWDNAPLDLQLFKQMMIDATSLGKDALHVYAGLILFIGVRLAWRRRGGWVAGWLLVLIVALAVEWLDVRAELVEANLRPDAEHWKDILNTLFWPSVLLLVGPKLQPRNNRTLEDSLHFTEAEGGSSEIEISLNRDKV